MAPRTLRIECLENRISLDAAGIPIIPISQLLGKTFEIRESENPAFLKFIVKEESGKTQEVLVRINESEESEPEGEAPEDAITPVQTIPVDDPMQGMPMISSTIEQVEEIPLVDTPEVLFERPMVDQNLLIVQSPQWLPMDMLWSSSSSESNNDLHPFPSILGIERSGDTLELRVRDFSPADTKIEIVTSSERFVLDTQCKIDGVKTRTFTIPMQELGSKDEAIEIIITDTRFEGEQYSKKVILDEVEESEPETHSTIPTEAGAFFGLLIVSSQNYAINFARKCRVLYRSKFTKNL